MCNIKGEKHLMKIKIWGEPCQVLPPSVETLSLLSGAAVTRYRWSPLAAILWTSLLLRPLANGFIGKSLSVII